MKQNTHAHVSFIRRAILLLLLLGCSMQAWSEGIALGGSSQGAAGSTSLVTDLLRRLGMGSGFARQGFAPGVGGVSPGPGGGSGGSLGAGLGGSTLANSPFKPRITP